MDHTYVDASPSTQAEFVIGSAANSAIVHKGCECYFAASPYYIARFLACLTIMNGFCVSEENLDARMEKIASED